MDDQSGAAHGNHFLFSDHALDVLVPERAEWRGCDASDALARVTALWNKAVPTLGDASEASVEQHLIKPLLSILGHTYEEQPSVMYGVVRCVPDYAFFASAEAASLARAEHHGVPGYFANAVAIGDAKPLNMPLDRKRGKEDNPTAQMCGYLYHSGVRWGIVTNGRYWRLFERDRSRNLDTYYEVDLQRLIDCGDPEAFRYFLAFFRREAFLAGDDGRCWLDEVLAESDAYRHELGEGLQARVYEALRLLVQGFLDWKSNRLGEGDVASVLDNALVVLYRLLFVHYAESRALLPTENAQYSASYGYVALSREVIAKLDSGSYPKGTSDLWERLLRLFGYIDKGQEELGIPAYNGGLFSAGEHPSVTKGGESPCWEIGDAALAEVIRLLAEDERRVEGGRVVRGLVDFRSLGVRHLGTIYEGLLELTPQVTNGEVALVNDTGERKASGSYYTPAFIVERLVANALEPAVERARREVEAARPGAEKELARLRKSLAKEGASSRTDEIARAMKAVARGLLEPYLRISVLDPAMGSGHFLVEAMDYIARGIVEDPNRLPEEPPLDPPASGGKNGGGSPSPLAGRAGEGASSESDIGLYRRLVAERCLYGVDLNPLAVELTKLSIWLASLTRDRPLSFLNHHLRCGDSLIGARVADLTALPPPLRKGRDKTQANDRMLDLELSGVDIASAVNAMLLIGTGPSEDREDVRHKADLFAKLQEQAARTLKPRLDLWCAPFFGFDRASGDYNEVARVLSAGEKPTGVVRGLVEEARRVAEAGRFFHWDIEFPEVFFDAKGGWREDAGFTAVIGNPPWERVKLQENEFFLKRCPEAVQAPTAAKRKRLIADLQASNPALAAEYAAAKEKAERASEWLRTSGQYPLLGRGDVNTYAVMLERAVSLMSPSGRTAMVVPSGIATDKTCAEFFRKVVDSRMLVSLLDYENRWNLAGKSAFPDVDSRFKFTLLALTGEKDAAEEVRCGCFLHEPEDANDPERVFPLSPADFELMNPNTRTCPVFRTRRDAELTRRIYRRVPVLVRETPDGDVNPWGVRYFTMFHMTNDSGLFRTRAELEAGGFYPVAGGRWKKGADEYWPLYEGKMVQMYDHRAASVRVDPDNVHRPGQPEATTAEQYADPRYVPAPQHLVPSADVLRRVGAADCQLAFKEITAPTNRRTMVCALVPPAGAGNKLPMLLRPQPRLHHPGLVAVLASVAFDFSARQKLGGQTLNWFILEQLPVLPPWVFEWPLARLADLRAMESLHEERAAPEDGPTLGDWVAERVLELTYTAHDMAAFAEDMGYVDEAGHVKPPFTWDEDRRLHLMCQLDAVMFLLYGLDREDADYVLSTFPIVKRHDEEAFGRYRTRDLILHYMAAYEVGDMDVRVDA